MSEHLVAILAEYLPRDRVRAILTWKSIDMAAREDLHVIGDIMVAETVSVPTPRIRESVRTFDSVPAYEAFLETMKMVAGL